MADTLDSKIDKMLDIQMETLSQIKRMSDVCEIRLQTHDNELKKIWKVFQNTEESRKEIALRLERVEKNCIANHAKEFLNPSGQRNGGNPEGMIESWVGGKLYSGLGVIVTTVITAAVGIYVGILIK